MVTATEARKLTQGIIPVDIILNEVNCYIESAAKEGKFRCGLVLPASYSEESIDAAVAKIEEAGFAVFKIPILPGDIWKDPQAICRAAISDPNKPLYYELTIAW